MTITIDSALLKQAKDALIESVYLVREAYRTNWRHGIPARKAQLDAEKAALDAHEKAISDIEAALAAQQPAPAWHDAPTCGGLWLNSCDGRASLFCRRKIESGSPGMAAGRWFGPIPEDTK